MDVDRDLLEASFVGKNSTGNYVYSKLLDIHVEPGVGKGQNDGSIMLRVNLKLQLDNGRNVTRSLMYKKKRNETSGHDLTEEIGLFKTEILIYNDFLMKMMKLSAKCGDLEEDLAPQCYGVGPDVILMEDLKDSGFIMLKSSDGMDRNHADLVVRSLARFHALSMKLIEDGSMDTSLLGPWWFHRNLPVVDNMFKGGINTLADVIEKDWSPEWKPAVQKLRDASKNLSYRLMILSQETKGSHLEVLNHGDCWSNNMMFNYDQDNILKSMRFVDFQVCHFNNLSWDLTYVIYNCVFPDNRRKWISSLIDLYTDTLTSHLTKYNYKGKIPTRDEIQHAMDKIIFFGFVNSINNIPVFIAMSLPDFEFDMDHLASSDSNEAPVAHQSRYYKSERVTNLMKGDLEYFMSLNVI